MRPGVTGGGFLKHDAAKHEYSGVLQLQFINLALQAFGLITTQVAGGAGYSLLALVDAEFPPVQLGWGFTLNGVGGLLAVHRTASTDALHAALKAGQLSTILFPKNAITNAPVILAQLDALFPTAPGRFLFGPMALIGWGTPTMLTASIAVVVELPEPVRVILLARIEARLPDASAPLVRINMDALGMLDLGKDELSFDAVLFDSRLVDLHAVGRDGAARDLGDGQREFVLAIGGFHPRFTPPAGFPTLQRITIDMPSGIVTKLRLAAYLAVTSNSIQFGANLDVSHRRVRVRPLRPSRVRRAAAAPSVPLRRRHLGLGRAHGGRRRSCVGEPGCDAHGAGAVQHCGASSRCTSCSSTCTCRSTTAGARMRRRCRLPSIDVGGLLGAALAELRQLGRAAAGRGVAAGHGAADRGCGLSCWRIRWRGRRCTSASCRSGLRSRASARRFRRGATTFTITDLHVGVGTIPHDAIQDDFAPAQFFELTDEEKLERPSFERHDAGLRVTGGLVTSGAPSAEDHGVRDLLRRHARRASRGKTRAWR